MLAVFQREKELGEYFQGVRYLFDFDLKIRSGQVWSLILVYRGEFNLIKAFNWSWTNLKEVDRWIDNLQISL